MGEYILNPYAFITLVGFIFQLILIFLVLTKNPKWVISKFFVLLAVPAAFWNLGEFFLRSTDPAYIDSTGYFWAKFKWSGIVVLPAFLLHFCLVTNRFFREKKPFKRMDVILYVIAAIFLFLELGTDYLVSGATEIWWGLTADRNNFPWWEFYSIYVTLFSFYGLYVLYKCRKEIDNKRYKKQLTLFLIALSIPVVGSIFSELVLAPVSIMLTGSRPYAFGSTTVVVGLVFFTYAILKYQLFDIKVQILVRKTLIYSMTVSMVILLFIMIVGASSFALRDLFASNQTVFYLGSLIVSAILFSRLERSSTKVVEGLFPHLKWKECEVGEAFLIESESGKLISHAKINPKIKLDPDSVAGMLTAVQMFVGDILKQEGKSGLNVLSYGDVKILIEHVDDIYMVVVFTGYEIDEMRGDVKRTMKMIASDYGDIIRKWDGDMQKVKGIETIIRGMLG
jgi:hypothetical protein